MDFFAQIFNNKILWISIFACFLAQFIKIFTGKEKRIDFSRIAMSGGMPSSHSSFVTSLSTLVGMDRGFDSVEFAICVVFALIVMYDASGVRRAVGKQAAILNKIVEDLQNKLQEVCDDSAMVQKYKDEAADYICGKYNWDEVVKRTLELYEK